MLFSTMPAPIYIPTNSTHRFSFSTSLPTLVTFCVMKNSHSNRYVVIPHSGFFFFFLAVSGLRCGTRDLCCVMQDLSL